MLNVPTSAQLADFTGVDESTFGTFVNSALLQATLMFMVVCDVDQPDYDSWDSTQQLLSTNGILAMADHLYLEQPFRQVNASPFQGETVGSYSYSKPASTIRGTAGALSLKGEQTSVVWYDLAVQMLSKRDLAGGVYVGQVQGLEMSDFGDQGVQVMINTATNELLLQGPSGRDWMPLPFDINADSGPH